MQNIKIENTWKEQLTEEFEKGYWLSLTTYVRNEYLTKKVFPPPKAIFHAFDLCPFDKVKVVIVGQDPYHSEGQANGLSFAVGKDITLPPSLKNIFKEIKSDLGQDAVRSGNLDRWAKQGVLLLNATLTVRAHLAGSHQNKGWEIFTDAVIHQATSTAKLRAAEPSRTRMCMPQSSLSRASARVKHSWSVEIPASA